MRTLILHESPYVDALLNDLDQQLGWADGRELVSIFFGVVHLACSQVMPFSGS